MKRSKSTILVISAFIFLMGLPQNAQNQSQTQSSLPGVEDTLQYINAAQPSIIGYGPSDGRGGATPLSLSPDRT